MAEAKNYVLALMRSYDRNKIEGGNGTLGVEERLFNTRFGTRVNAPGGMFSEVGHFSELTFCAQANALAIYPQGTLSALRGLVGSIAVPAWGSVTFENTHIAWGSFFVTSPIDGVGSYAWRGQGW